MTACSPRRRNLRASMVNEEIRAAHERLERKEQFGKIVLAP